MIRRCVELLLVFLLVLTGCSDYTNKDNSDALVTVEGQSLYASDLAKIIPEGITSSDSAMLVETYIQNWAIDILMFANAQRNITNQAEIDKMVEDYRRSLIINSYQQRIMQERLQSPTEEEIASFYDEHKGEFELTDYIVKGVLLKIPNNAPKQDVLRKHMRKLDMPAIEYIEKYSVQYALSYDYLLDNYVYYNDLTKKIPLTPSDIGTFLSQTKFYEAKDSSYTYMLSLTDYVPIGEAAPLELVHDKASAMLFNVRKMGYIREFAKTLFEDAERKGKIEYNTTKP